MAPLPSGLGKAFLELVEGCSVGSVHEDPVLVLTGVGAEIAAAKVLDVLLGIADGGLNRGMPEKLLDLAEVCPVGEKMGSAGMAEGVDREAVLVEACPPLMPVIKYLLTWMRIEAGSIDETEGVVVAVGEPVRT